VRDVGRNHLLAFRPEVEGLAVEAKRRIQLVDHLSFHPLKRRVRARRGDRWKASLCMSRFCNRSNKGGFVLLLAPSIRRANF
jgi:hypothetical protein